MRRGAELNQAISPGSNDPVCNVYVVKLSRRRGKGDRFAMVAAACLVFSIVQLVVSASDGQTVFRLRIDFVIGTRDAIGFALHHIIVANDGTAISADLVVITRKTAMKVYAVAVFSV